MTEQQFCYWLQGFVELNAGFRPTPDQWQSICEHLALCFKKVTPPVRPSQLPTVGPMTMEDFRKIYDRTTAQPWPNPTTITC